MVLNASLPVFNFLGIIFVLLPSPWHWRARNAPTLLYIFWCLVTVIPAFINNIVWFDRSDNVAPVWCDIVSKLRIGGIIGLGCASFCLTRQLEAIAAARQVHFTREDRRRRFIIDLSIGLGLPILVMVGHVIVQGHRFDILERVGCLPTVYWSVPALLLVEIWPVLLYTAAAIYAGLAMRLFISRRYQFAKILESSQSAITTGRFLRLVALAIIQIGFNLPLVVYTLANNLQLGFQPYVSWDYVHDQFGTVIEVTLAELYTRPKHVIALSELTYWSYAVSCAIFFVFFGLGPESLAEYRSWYRRAIGAV